MYILHCFTIFNIRQQNTTKILVAFQEFDVTVFILLEVCVIMMIAYCSFLHRNLIRKIENLQHLQYLDNPTMLSVEWRTSVSIHY